MLNAFLRARLFRIYRWQLTPIHRMLLWAMLVGFLGALAVIAFREAIHGLQWLLVGRSGSLVEMARGLPWQIRFALPVLGGVAAGFVLMAARRLTTSPSSDYMEAVNRSLLLQRTTNGLTVHQEHFFDFT